MASSASARRAQVYVGELPDDFLCISSSPRPSETQQQITSDEQAARALQYGGGQSQQNYGYMGRLSITVAQARLAKNYGMTRMDPYCRIRVGHAVFETPTDVNGSKNPRWNKTIQCNLGQGIDSIHIELFDEKAFTTDNKIAWALIPIPQVIQQGETKDDWFPLTGKQGEDKEGMINLIFSFTQVPVPMMPMYQAPQQVVYGGQIPVVMPGGYAYTPVAAPVPVYPPQHQGPPQQQQQQQPRPQPAPITQADLQAIQEMFPGTDSEVIRSVLEANRGNKDLTIDALLQMT